MTRRRDITKGSLAQLAGLLAALVTLGAARAALAQIPDPIYADLYWEASGHSWDGDIASYAASQQASGDAYWLDKALMTTDGIDSFVESMLESQWVADLAGYGVTSVTKAPWSFVLVPEAEAGLAACSGVTPSSSLLSDFEANLAGFVNCAIAAQPQLGASNVVLNVFLPPWVAGGPLGAGDPCSSGTQYGGSSSGGNGGYFGYNELVDGHSIAVLPTEPTCQTGLTRLVWTISHEDAETTSQQRQIADVCEGLPGSGEPYVSLPFLSPILNTSSSLADYEQLTPGVTVNWMPVSDGGSEPECIQNGAQVACQCVPQVGSVPAMNPPSGPVACGSGQNLIVQMQLDESASRNPPPWDLPNATNGYTGSLYVTAEVQGPTTWAAGGGHVVGLPNPVATPWLQWTSAGYLELDGFGSGYGGANVAPALSSIDLSVYDPVWGQLNAATLGGSAPPSVQAEPPASYSEVYAVPSGYAPWPMQGRLLGSSSCGMPGHTVGPVPNGDTTVTLSVSGPTTGDIYPGSVVTDSGGYFNFDYLPGSPGMKIVEYTTPTLGPALTWDVTLVVGPEIDGISPPRGLVAGGNLATLTGKGLQGTLRVQFSYQGPSGQVDAPVVFATGNAAGTQATFRVPPSVLPAPGAGVEQVAVYSENGAQWSESLPYTYLQANTPYLTFRPAGGKVCYPSNGNQVTAVVLDSFGNFDPNRQIAFRPISPNITFAPTTIYNGGTTDAWFSVTGSAPYDFTALATGGNAVEAALKDYWVPPPIVCHPESVGNPTPHGGHQAAAVYGYLGGQWHPPVLGDPWDWADPEIGTISSPYSPSSFMFYTLSQDEIYQLASFVSPTGNAAVMFPYPSPLASNVCFTGRALHVSMENQPPDWSVTVAYPLDRNVSPAAYRVFGLNESNGVWVQMSSTVEHVGSGYRLIARDESVDPNHEVPGAVNGPYALVYYSSSACP